MSCPPDNEAVVPTNEKDNESNAAMDIFEDILIATDAHGKGMDFFETFMDSAEVQEIFAGPALETVLARQGYHLNRKGLLKRMIPKEYKQEKMQAKLAKNNAGSASSAPLPAATKAATDYYDPILWDANEVIRRQVTVHHTFTQTMP